MLCRLGPNSPGRDAALCGPAGSLEDAVLGVASTGDQAAMDPLPPILMHSNGRASAQKLWGGLRESEVEHANYKHGPPKALGKVHRLIGGAILPIRGRPYPVLLYADTTEHVIVAVVNNVPMAALEADLYAARDHPSQLEVKWKGDGLAASHGQCYELTGAHMHECGLACMPGYLFSTDKSAYHLVRPGPVPFLHMRVPASDYEVELVEKAVHARIIDAAEPNEGGTPCPVSRNDPLLTATDPVKMQLSHLNGRFNFMTVFDRAPNAGGSRVVSNTDAATSRFASKIASIPALVTAIATMLGCEHTGEFTSAVDDLAGECARAVMVEASALARQPVINVLSELTSSASRLCTLRRIGHGGEHALASSIFAASDVGLAVREISWDEGSQRCREKGCDAIGSMVGLMWNMARRVDEQTAMLCIELGPGREILTMRLINACVEYEIDMDAAARLLECPWVIAVAHLNTSQTEPVGWFTVEVAGVKRDMLKVCDSVRKTYGLEAQRHVRPMPTQAQLDYTELDKRLKRMEDIAAAPTPAPPAPTRAAVAGPSIPYTSPELEHLKAATKRWALLGKRPR